MSAQASRFTTLFTLGCSFLLGSALYSPAAEITLQRVPALTIEQAPAYPENVARFHTGATVEALPQSNANLVLSTKGNDSNTAEAALLCDDPTIGYALSRGENTLIVSLSKIENIDSISFLNRGAKGEMTVAVSNTKLPAGSAQWRQVAQRGLESDVNLKVGPNEAKYLKLSFNVNEAGRISALGVYSTTNVAAFTTPRARVLTGDNSEGLALISYNFTDVHTKARALFVSSGDHLKQANNMIDDQSSTSYSFASTDANPTVVIDLGKVTGLRRISAIYSARSGNVDFFVAQSLPAGLRSGSKVMRLDDGAFADMQMVGSVADSHGHVAVDFAETPGRYLIVRFSTVASSTPFSVAEIAAFGSSTGGWLASNTVAAAMESDGKDLADAKDAKDLGDSKEIPAEGPAEGPGPGLPQPPPFVFVPETLPTSP